MATLASIQGRDREMIAIEVSDKKKQVKFVFKSSLFNDREK